MDILSDNSPVFEYNYADADRLVTCECCKSQVAIGDTITVNHKTFCRDSAACVWRQQGKKITVEVLPCNTRFKKPLFGD
jgi:hypothetical protein